MSQSLQESVFSCNHLPEDPGGNGIWSKSAHGTSISYVLIYCISSIFAFLDLSDFPIVIFEISSTMKSLHSEGYHSFSR